MFAYLFVKCLGWTLSLFSLQCESLKLFLRGYSLGQAHIYPLMTVNLTSVFKFTLPFHAISAKLPASVAIKSSC